MAHSELEPPPAISSMNDMEISRESHQQPADPIKRRLFIGLGVSVLLNAILWPFAAQFVRHHKIVAPQTIEVTFVPRVAPQPVKPKRARPPHKVIARPKPIIKLIPKPIVPAPHPHVTPPARHQAQPQHQAHNRVLISPGKTTQPSDHTALSGGNASPGKPTEEQNPGNDQTNTPAPPPQTPAPDPSQTPPVTAPAHAPQAPPTPPPPAGPTRDAEPASQVLPDIPDDLKQDDFKSSVRVKVDISPDGTFVPTLRSSSGNDQIDAIVLEALKKWKWKPALRDGQSVESIQLFRFDFEVN